ncbi:MAG TPA: DUF4126 domain-containing protein [Nocardioidaceae bacterium]|nr:DUF4126 domain-containing protein [Nocardioidaceae bacterium]
MDLLPMAFSSGWASGVNSYLVVLVLGLVGRVSGTEEIPEVLTRTDVLVVAAVMYAWEFVADKIPYVDSTWDAISTAIRPTVGAVIGVLLAGDVDTLDQAIYGVVGGGSALASHLVKAGTRLAINTSPEPVTNGIASVAEDVTVLGVVSLAIYHPWIALGIASTLLVVGIVVLFFAFKLVRRGWRRWKGRSATAH